MSVFIASIDHFDIVFDGMKNHMCTFIHDTLSTDCKLGCYNLSIDSYLSSYFAPLSIKRLIDILIPVRIE